MKLLSDATDIALDFILRILPAMEIPPFDGVKEGMIYHLSNLSMKGFKVKKENIAVKVAGMQATKSSKKPETKAEEVPSEQGNVASLSVEPGPSADVNASFESVESEMSFKNDAEGAKATELLIIHVQEISSILNDVIWSFEQTYMPYLKGNGMANVKFTDGSIRLQFELRKRRKAIAKGGEEWEPVLCLHDRSCVIEEVNLELQGEGRITWVLNKLASIFKGPLRDYVVTTIKTMLTSQSGFLLEKLNAILSPYWNLIMKTAKLDMVSYDSIRP